MKSAVAGWGKKKNRLLSRQLFDSFHIVPRFIRPPPPVGRDCLRARSRSRSVHRSQARLTDVLRQTTITDMARSKSGAMQVVPFRVPDELVKRLDKYAGRLRREQPGLRATRADALRMLLTEALDQKEARNVKA